VDGIEVGGGRGFFVAGVDDAAEVVEHQVSFDLLLDFGDEGVFGDLGVARGAENDFEIDRETAGPLGGGFGVGERGSTRILE
jgi:hypothetical protein